MVSDGTRARADDALQGRGVVVADDALLGEGHAALHQQLARRLSQGAQSAALYSVTG